MYKVFFVNTSHEGREQGWGNRKVAMGVSFIRTDSSGFDTYESYNRNYYAARMNS